MYKYKLYIQIIWCQNMPDTKLVFGVSFSSCLPTTSSSLQWHRMACGLRTSLRQTWRNSRHWRSWSGIQSCSELFDEDNFKRNQRDLKRKIFRRENFKCFFRYLSICEAISSRTSTTGSLLGMLMWTPLAVARGALQVAYTSLIVTIYIYIISTKCG